MRGMLKEDAIRHFGSQAALARALGIKQPSINDWGEVVPPLRQLQIEQLTGGRLKADPQILHPVTSPQQASHGRRRGQQS